MNATTMKEALEWIRCERNTWPESVSDCKVAAAEAVDGITDEMVARMDWAAGLTDKQIAYLHKGMVLAMHAAEQFGEPADERAIIRLADALEALP